MQKRIKDQFSIRWTVSVTETYCRAGRDGWWALKSTAYQGLNTLRNLFPGSRIFLFHLSWKLFGADILVPEWAQLCPWQELVFFWGSLKRWSVKKPFSLLNSLHVLKKKIWNQIQCLVNACASMLGIFHVQMQNSPFILGRKVIGNL